MSAPPVISSVSTMPRRLLDASLAGRPTMMMAGPGGMMFLADAVAWVGTHAPGGAHGRRAA